MKRPPPESLPPLPCWFCRKAIPIVRVLQDGILLVREAVRGGPRRLVLCPHCLKENLCEETQKGRWFSSPNVRLGLLDFLFTSLPGGVAEEILQAVTWFRQNEERRRFFFLADGDTRYEGEARRFLKKLWPWGGAEPNRGGPRNPKPSAGKAKARPRPAGPSKAESRPPPARAAHRPVTPYEVLGVAAGASRDDIRRAFLRLARHYHPDKVHHLGEEFEAMAHVKFQELLAAYEALSRR